LQRAGRAGVERRLASARYDAGRDRMFLFGGYSYDGTSHYMNDVWSLPMASGAAWELLAPSGALPAGRDDHEAIYDSAHDRMVVFAGNGSMNLDDTWSLAWNGPVSVTPGRSRIVLAVRAWPNPATLSAAIEFRLPRAAGDVDLSM